MGGNPNPFRPIADDSNRPFLTNDQCLTRICIDGADTYICRYLCSKTSFNELSRSRVFVHVSEFTRFVTYILLAKSGLGSAKGIKCSCSVGRLMKLFVLNLLLLI